MQTQHEAATATAAAPATAATGEVSSLTTMAVAGAGRGACRAETPAVGMIQLQAGRQAGRRPASLAAF